MSALFRASATGVVLATGHGAPTITAEVVGHDEDDEAAAAGGGGLWWVVQVSTAHDGFNAYRIKRRYRQFDVLDKTLRAAFQGVPDLPGKAGWLSSSDKDFLDKRKAGLSSYLRSITLDPALSQNEDVRSFRSLLARLVGVRGSEKRLRDEGGMVEG